MSRAFTIADGNELTNGLRPQVACCLRQPEAVAMAMRRAVKFRTGMVTAKTNPDKSPLRN
jgi:hypothetical protein